jgi:enoyl-CoA hydratase
MTDATVGVDIDPEQRVAVVTLDHPDRRNALTLPLVEQLVAAFDAIEAGEEAGAVVVTGAPPAFCAGADLSDLGRSKEAGLRAIYEGFLRIARSPLPTVAAVNGAAVGAGMNLALCCDVRLVARSARFDTRFLQLGIHPGGGHTWMLDRIVGAQAAAAMVLFGEVLDGEAAAARGLAWRCVEDDELLPEARRLAATAAANPPELTRRTKQTLRTVPTLDAHDAAVDLELETQVWSMEQPWFAERLAALKARIKSN